jgi:hypothetical protein
LPSRSEVVMRIIEVVSADAGRNSGDDFVRSAVTAEPHRRAVLPYGIARPPHRRRQDSRHRSARPASTTKTTPNSPTAPPVCITSPNPNSPLSSAPPPLPQDSLLSHDSRARAMVTLR